MLNVALIDDTFDVSEMGGLSATRYDAVLCLFWAAPETLSALGEQTKARCVSLHEIVGSVEEWEREAAATGQKLCRGGPKYRGMPWRAYLSEALYGELLLWCLAERTLDFVAREWGNGTIGQIDYVLAPRLESAFAVKHKAYPRMPSLARLKQKRVAKPIPRWKRVLRRGRELALTGGWRQQVWHLAAELDAEYKWRAWRGEMWARPGGARGGVTLFSSYANNSRTLAAFQNMLPKPLEWIVTNYSAKAGATHVREVKHWLWGFARRGDRRAEAPEDKRLEGDDAGLNEWLMGGASWQGWKGHELRALAKLTRWWENYLELAHPRLVVTASGWGLDGWLMRLARAHKIATLQLLHGAVGGYYYTQLPIESDVLVVWGEFWQELWCPEERDKIFVVAPRGLFATVPRREAEGRRRLTFFSWQVSHFAQYSESELLGGMVDVLHRLVQGSGIEVNVRFHPAENPGDFLRCWQLRHGALPKNVRLSKREPLQAILAETDVALMYHSTVFMDCLVNKIPVVLPGWIDFDWNGRMARVPGIHLAKSFGDLEERLRTWLKESPEMDEEAASWFVDEGEGERGRLERWVAAQSNGAGS